MSRNVCLLAISYILFGVLLGCTKPPEDDNNNNQSGNTVYEPGDTATTIFIASNVSSGGLNRELLTAYNPDKSIKWVIDSLNISNWLSAPLPNPYINGVFYQSIYVRSASGTTTNQLCAINPATGKFIFKIINPNNYVPFSAKNDTLFCTRNTNPTDGNYGQICALNAKTGALLWEEPNSGPYLPLRPVTEGNLVYFYYFHSQTRDQRVKCYNMATHTIQWDVFLSGVVSGNSVQSEGFTLSGNYLVFNTKIYHLAVLAKSNGNLVWRNTGTYYEKPLVDGNTVYTSSVSGGVYAFNLSTGAPIWNWPKYSWFPSGLPFLANHQLYVIGSDTTKYLAAFDAASGKKNWSKTTTNFLQRQVVAGDKIYAIKQSSYPGNAGTSSILIYNALNGNIKDSISLSGNSFGFPMVLTANGKFLVNNVY